MDFYSGRISKCLAQICEADSLPFHDNLYYNV